MEVDPRPRRLSNELLGAHYRSQVTSSKHQDCIKYSEILKFAELARARELLISENTVTNLPYNKNPPPIFWWREVNCASTTIVRVPRTDELSN